MAMYDDLLALNKLKIHQRQHFLATEISKSRNRFNEGFMWNT